MRTVPSLHGGREPPFNLLCWGFALDILFSPFWGPPGPFFIWGDIVNAKINDMVKLVDIGSLKPYKGNPRKNERAVEPVANSIREFGFKQPIVVDKDNTVIAGHTRLLAAKELGLKEVPVIVADDLTPGQVKAYRLADNKTGELAVWDFEQLDVELGDIADIDMGQFGFLDIEPPDTASLDDEQEAEERLIVRFVFSSYQAFKPHEDVIAQFAQSIGADMTIGK